MIAIFIDSKLETYINEIKYSFDYVFQTLGYSHRYVDKINQLKDNDIVICYSITEPKTYQDIAEIVDNRMMLFIKADKDLYLPGAINKDYLQKYLRKFKLQSYLAVICKDDFQKPALMKSFGPASFGIINFDIIGNIFFQFNELEKIQREKTGKNDHISLFEPYLSLPYVNYLLFFIEGFLKDFIKMNHHYIAKKELWPCGETLAVTVSHNVNKLQKWNLSYYLKYFFEDIRDFCLFHWKTLFRNVYSRTKYLFTNYEAYWNFSDVQEVDKKYGAKGTWFVAVNAETNKDVDYNFEDHDLLEEIRRLEKEKYEISLLGSCNSLLKDRFEKEADIFKNFFNTKEFGVRQLSSKLLANSLEEHHKARVRYDSSKGHKERYGYNNGTALPYRAFSSKYFIKHYEIPPTFSDTNLKLSKYKYLPFDTAKAVVQEILFNTKQINGLAHFNFSMSNFYDIPYLKKLYKYLLDNIKAKHVYKPTLIELTQWWSKRESVIVDEGENEIQMFFVEAVELFTLTIYGRVKITSVEGADATHKHNQIRFVGVKANTPVSIKLEKDLKSV